MLRVIRDAFLAFFSLVLALAVVALIGALAFAIIVTLFPSMPQDTLPVVVVPTWVLLICFGASLAAHYGRR